MSDILRQEVTTAAQSVVVKVGTRVLTRPSGTLDETRIAALAEQLSRLRHTGRRVVLVSSGAVGAGMSQLGLSTRPDDLAQLQAVAAVGQTHLIETYDRTFRKHNLHAAQVLLTAHDFDDRARYLNVRNTLLALMEHGVIPVINENDTVAVDELMATFGDNDRLAALVTNLLRAPLLIILSDVDGLYDAAPDSADAKLIPTVTQFDDQLFSYVRDAETGLSRGGMASKLEAAKIATLAGENVIVAAGRRARVIDEIMDAKSAGTLFVAPGSTLKAKKRWIGFSAQPCGKLTIDDGACRAITEQGRSLLAIGITAVAGQFNKGDVVAIHHADGVERARGLSNYSSAELQKIQGLRSDRIAQVLGHQPYEEVIHRDNLIVVKV